MAGVPSLSNYVYPASAPCQARSWGEVTAVPRTDQILPSGSFRPNSSPKSFQDFPDIENNIKRGTSLLVQWELPVKRCRVQVRSHMLHGVTKKKKLKHHFNQCYNDLSVQFSSANLRYCAANLRDFSFCRTDIVYPLTLAPFVPPFDPWHSIFSLNLTSLSTLYKWNHNAFVFSGWPVSLSIRSSRLCML